MQSAFSFFPFGGIAATCTTGASGETHRAVYALHVDERQPDEAALEQRLLRAALSGDEDAFRRLVDPHRVALHAHCYRLLGSLHQAEDALQEALLRAWRALPG